MPVSFRAVFRGNLPVAVGIQSSENLPPFVFGEFFEELPFTEFRKVQTPAAVGIQLTEFPGTFLAVPADLMDLFFAQASVAIRVETCENPFALLFRKARKPRGGKELVFGNHAVAIGIHTPEAFPALAKGRAPVLSVAFPLLAVGAFLPFGTFPSGTPFPLRKNG